MKSVPQRASARSMINIALHNVMRSVPQRGSAGSMIRIASHSGMRSVPQRASAGPDGPDRESHCHEVDVVK